MKLGNFRDFRSAHRWVYASRKSTKRIQIADQSDETRQVGCREADMPYKGGSLQIHFTRITIEQAYVHKIS